MRKLILTLLSISMVSSLAFSQTVGLPENPTPGKCYIQCITPDEWGTKTVSVMVSPEYSKLEVVPAVYKTVSEEIMVKPASVKYVYVPAEFKTVTEEIQVEDPYNAIAIKAASFTPSSETVEILPSNAGWEYQSSLAECKSDDPRDCMVMCYVEKDAENKTIATQLLGADASISKTEKGGKTITVTKQVLVKEATTEKVELPAVFETITKKVLVSDESTKKVTVPAEYVSETIQVLNKKGGLAVWEEIDCELTNFNVLPIYYELGSASLTAASKKVVDDKLYQLMVQKPLIRVEINSHTDSRGSSSTNQSLSQQRAAAVVNYLISKGISRDRLIAKGYGETRLINGCENGVSCSEQEHLQNRRTEFRVLSN